MYFIFIFNLVLWFFICVVLNNKVLIITGNYVEVAIEVCVILKMINGILLLSTQIPF
jgi:hypothetical protein